MGPTVQERLATLEAELRHQAMRQEEAKAELAAMREEFRQDLKAQTADITTIKDILTQAKGGWKVFIGVGTVAGILVSGLSWAAGKLLPFIWSLPR